MNLYITLSKVSKFNVNLCFHQGSSKLDKNKKKVLCTN